jgi:hypothetical protein
LNEKVVRRGTEGRIALVGDINEAVDYNVGLTGSAKSAGLSIIGALPQNFSMKKWNF